MFLNKITDLLPWKIQTFLGYRPKGVIENIDELDSTKVKKGNFSFPIDELPIPFNCEESDPKPFSDLKSKKILDTFNSFYLVELNNSTYLNVYGYDTIIENNYVIEPLTFRRDKSFILGDYPKIHPALTMFKYPPKKLLKGNVLVLSSLSCSTNYGHWTMDLIPKIGSFKKLGFDWNDFDYVLINKLNFSFQKEMLLALDFPFDKIIETGEGDCFLCEKLVVPSHETFSMASYDFLKNKLAPKLNVVSNENTPKRIYISRKNAKWARIVNEEEILPALKKYDFDIIQFEDYTIVEQINFMQNSDFVIGVQGSGLINVAYQKENSKIIEICDKNNIVLTYYIFGVYNKLKQGVLFADSVKNKNPELYDDMRIDASKFECLLDKMIEE